MSLDIALGLVVLVASIRGWFKGFVVQAIHLTALVSSVFLASPLRDLGRPYAREYFPGVQPELLDRLLWWSGAVASYLILTGVAVSTLRLYRRRHYLEGLDRDRGDQGAGFVLGAAKGALVVIFLAAGIESHAPAYVQTQGWIARQVSQSWSVRMTQRHHPADQIWNSSPVQTVVQQVRREGLWGESPQATQSVQTSDPSNSESSASVPAALPALPLALPGPTLDPNSPRFLEELDRAIRREVEPPTRR